MKVLLVQVPSRDGHSHPMVLPPLGLAYVAAAVRKAGHEVGILDGVAEQLDWQKFEDRVLAEKPDVVGITGTTALRDVVQRAVRLLRPHVRWLVIGGADATACPEEMLGELPEVDYVVAGEAEESFVELLGALAQGVLTPDIPGVWYPGFTPSPPNLSDVRLKPWPARDLLPNHLYRFPLLGSGPVATMITSRGCPYPCIFCDKGGSGNRWRPRDPEDVVAEMEEVVERFGVTQFVMYDDQFMLDKERVASICERLLAKPWRVTWKAEARVDGVDQGILELMARAGCRWLAMGVESANPHGLAYLRKKTTPEMVRRAFTLAKRAKIRTLGYFILGIPVESWGDALRTIRFSRELDPDIAQFSILSPYPGTPLFAESKKNGWYRRIPALNYFDLDLERPVVVSPHWSEERLQRIITVAQRSFFFRPRFLLRTFQQQWAMGNVRWLLEAGVAFVRRLLPSGVR